MTGTKTSAAAAAAAAAIHDEEQGIENGLTWYGRLYWIHHRLSTNGRPYRRRRCSDTERRIDENGMNRGPNVA